MSYKNRMYIICFFGISAEKKKIAEKKYEKNYA